MGLFDKKKKENEDIDFIKKSIIPSEPKDSLDTKPAKDKETGNALDKILEKGNSEVGKEDSEPTKPITEPTKPITEPTKPITEPTKPITEPTKPVEANSGSKFVTFGTKVEKPASEQLVSKPDAPSKPVVDPKPFEKEEKPSDVQKKTEEQENLIKEQQKLIDEQKKSIDDLKKLVDEQKKRIDDIDSKLDSAQQQTTKKLEEISSKVGSDVEITDEEKRLVKAGHYLKEQMDKVTHAYEDLDKRLKFAREEIVHIQEIERNFQQTEDRLNAIRRDVESIIETDLMSKSREAVSMLDSKLTDSHEATEELLERLEDRINEAEDRIHKKIDAAKSDLRERIYELRRIQEEVEGSITSKVKYDEAKVSEVMEIIHTLNETVNKIFAVPEAEEAEEQEVEEDYLPP